MQTVAPREITDMAHATVYGFLGKILRNTFNRTLADTAVWSSQNQASQRFGMKENEENL